ncbi:aminotransferase class V-fold PLP-dependent enzyme [Nocardioides sp. BP30]|uniref:aminotransferase class V-fold PLP-dependent enzyme n=1 Tax=Nocardioides sp. BP30 TaxID=3036374 RepID=UPI0024682E17|nr:aminotransferase class V-fold PLP-dependent enzyme [Nocardioides sp. BP30]WGL51794.1 aminotransferase class V-fold PLP-dependent enzyme [Nocardioides sp. BP30]
MSLSTPSGPVLPAADANIEALLPLAADETRVPLLDGRWVRYANLDGAASTPALASVAARVAEVTPWYSSVHRGAGYLSQVSTALYEEARHTIATFVDAREDDIAVITRNTTDAVNLLASAVPGRTLVLDIEHHANLLPWQRSPHGVTVVTGESTVARTLAALEAELVGSRHALLAITGASNVTGESLPIDRVVALAHEHGARVLLDGAQLLPHRRFSLTATGVDYVAFSGHKLYAPYGAGALIGRRDWLDDAPAYLAGGGSVQRVTVEGATWSPAPARHEGGTPNLIGALAIASACEALAALDPVAWEHHERVLRERLVEGLGAIPEVSTAALWEDAAEPVGVVTFTVAGADAGLVATYLSAEHGIGVRDGKFCAHPLVTRLGLVEGALRASVGLGNGSEDVDRLLAGLRAFVSALATGELEGRYRSADGLWGLAADPRPLPRIAGLAALARTASACRG